MPDRIFGEREKAIEEAYFRAEDARLLEKLRQGARLDEITAALRDKLHIDNPDLLATVRALGATSDTAAAFYLAPLVQVAWADGKVARESREAVLRFARERGVEPGSPAYAQLEDWLAAQPPAALFSAAVQVLKIGFNVLPPAERDERITEVLGTCHQVAEASAGLGRFLGHGSGVSPLQNATIEEIARGLRSHD
jgi:hypothetical protein